MILHTQHLVPLGWLDSQIHIALDGSIYPMANEHTHTRNERINACVHRANPVAGPRHLSFTLSISNCGKEEKKNQKSGMGLLSHNESSQHE